MLSLKIKNARESFGWSQRRLAEEAGLSFSYVGMVESGKIKPSLKSLDKLANALKVDPSFLIEKEPGLLPYQFKDHLTLKEKEFIAQQKNKPWITLASELVNEGVTPDEIKDLMKTVLRVRGIKKQK